MNIEQDIKNYINRKFSYTIERELRGTKDKITDELFNLLRKHKVYKYTGDTELDILNDIINYEDNYNEYMKRQHDELKYKYFYEMIEKFFRVGTCYEMLFSMYGETSYKEKIREMDRFLINHKYELYLILDKERTIRALVILTREIESDIEYIYIEDFMYRNYDYYIGKDLIKYIVLQAEYLTYEHVKLTDKIFATITDKPYADQDVVKFIEMFKSLGFKEET